MGAQSNPSAGRDYRGAMWHTEPFARSPRPWLLAILSLTSIALVIVASFGPWLYAERGPEWDLKIRIVAGINTDGVFSLFFAVVAALALLVALIRPDWWILALVACAAMMMCTLVGLFDWVIFDPMDLAMPPGQRANLIRVEWGLKLLTAAAPVGAASTLLLARQLVRGDY